ncbi:hypothetical protein EBU99_11140 [bacterium]|nr:hypothetical protein [bacterium]
MRVDLLTLYAFSDKTHAKQRELWRGFMALVMPVLLECDPNDFERLLESASCRSVDELMESLEAPKSVSALIWSMSGNFSEILGFEPEMGLSAFLEVNLPTRVHAIAGVQSQISDETLISSWLKAFREIQQQPEFVEITSEWKKAFEVFLEDVDAVLSEESHSPEANDDSMSAHSKDSGAENSNRSRPSQRRRKTG